MPSKPSDELVPTKTIIMRKRVLYVFVHPHGPKIGSVDAPIEDIGPSNLEKYAPENATGALLQTLREFTDKGYSLSNWHIIESNYRDSSIYLKWSATDDYNSFELIEKYQKRLTLTPAKEPVGA